MADNISVLDYAGATIILATSEAAGVHTPKHVLVAGSAIIGKVGIDQTTPGTTNLVAAAGPVAAGATDSGNPVKVGAVYNSTLPTYTTGQRADLQTDAKGNLRVYPSLGVAAGSDGVSNATIGWAQGSTSSSSQIVQAIAPFKFNGTSWDRDRKPNATHRLLSAAASTNATSVKGSAGDVHKIRGYNAAASALFLKFYNKATAPTVGTDTPVLTIRLAPTADFIIDLAGQYFGTGIAYAITGAAADADTTAVSAGDVTCLNITYA